MVYMYVSLPHFDLSGVSVETAPGTKGERCTGYIEQARTLADCKVRCYSEDDNSNNNW